MTYPCACHMGNLFFSVLSSISCNSPTQYSIIIYLYLQLLVKVLLTHWFIKNLSSWNRANWPSWEYAVSQKAFENNSLCKIWGANKVYYGEFENRELQQAKWCWNRNTSILPKPKCELLWWWCSVLESLFTNYSLSIVPRCQYCGHILKLNFLRMSAKVLWPGK